MWPLAQRHLRHQRVLIAVLLVAMVGFEILLIRVAADLEEGPGLSQMLGMLPGFMQDIVSAYVADVTFANAVALGFLDPGTVVPCIAFIMLLATIPAADKETGALDLYLTRPIRRGSYLASSLVCIVLSALALPAALLLGCVIGLALTDGPGEQPWTHYVPSAVSMSTMLLATGGLTLWVAAGADRRGAAVVKVVGVLVVSYVVEFLSFFWAPLQWVVWASPFHYFKPIPGVLEGSLSPTWNAVALLVAFVVATGAAFRRFGGRDV